LKIIKATITPPTSVSQYSDTARADSQYQKTTSLPAQTKAYALYCSICDLISNKIDQILVVRKQDGCRLITAHFNNMRTLQFKAELTNSFFASVNQMFGSSSPLPTTAEHCFVF